jgi:hypothetical protein
MPADFGPADFTGLSNKGCTAYGKDPDLVLFDPAAIKPLPHEWRADLPAGRRTACGTLSRNRVQHRPPTDFCSISMNINGTFPDSY